MNFASDDFNAEISADVGKVPAISACLFKIHTGINKLNKVRLRQMTFWVKYVYWLSCRDFGEKVSNTTHSQLLSLA